MKNWVTYWVTPYFKKQLPIFQDKRDAIKQQLKDGINPSEQRKAVKAAKTGVVTNSFEVVAREWFSEHKSKWVNTHSDKIIRRLERDIFPWIGNRPIAEITAPKVLTVIKQIRDRGVLETAHRALGNCGQVFRYGVQTGRCIRESWLRSFEQLIPIYK